MLDWFLNKLRDSDADTTRAARLVAAFSLGTSLAGLTFVPILYYFSGPGMGVYCAVLAPLIGSAAFVLRWSGRVTIAAQYYLLWLWALISGVSAALGGVRSPSFPAYAVVILAATFLVGPRSGLRWMVVSLVSTVVIQLAQGRWIAPPKVSDDNLALLYILSLATVFGLAYMFSLQYDQAKNKALSELRSANRRITQMVIQLEHASTRLVHSSQRFLGSRTPEHAGLIAEMMHKARDGRASLDQSRTSVQGMIEQYRQIAMRVQSLNDYSQVIIELVTTIDRISDRLDLIALNIGIAAARSGEAGKQFTVLAGDMRLLAERVLSETKQIKAALRQVHTQVHQALDSSTSGQVLTEESARRMASMAETFDDIFALIEQTGEATGQMTDDTLAQIDAVRKLVSATVASQPPAA